MIALGIASGLVIGTCLGMLGGGGSILTVPVLVYAMAFEPKAAIVSSLVVVGTTSLTGTLQHARRGDVDWSTGLAFGAAGMVGAYGGGLLSASFSDRTLLIGFAAVMFASAVGMFRRRPEPTSSGRAPLPAIAALGAAAGALTGLIGAGGGFVIVPALVLLAGVPMRTAVGTSLLVITMNTMAGYLAHLHQDGVGAAVTAAMSVAAVLGSLAGGALSSHVPAQALRRGFALLVLMLATVVVLTEIT